NHDSAESIALDRWLQAALQRLAARNRSWPPGQLTFAFAVDAEHGVVGVAADSRDRAGRRFPVAIYARIPRPPRVLCGTAALVLASKPFVDGARALLALGAELSPTQVPLRLRRLCPPMASEVQAAADELASDLATRRLDAFAAPLFGAAPAPESRARAALDRVRQRRSATGSPFECFELPVKSVHDVAVWAHWFERTHGRPSAALWGLPEREAALLASGPLPERAPLFWTLPAQSYPQLCRTGEDTTALEPAGVGGGERSLAAVFDELAQSATLAVSANR
ncbi:MAG TPA: TagF domain-containing protein, partial [Polyangiaceae bacterium]|nr:TagF domain-containing protein [Polyangiaceae bacterium]